MEVNKTIDLGRMSQRGEHMFKGGECIIIKDIGKK